MNLPADFDAIPINRSLGLRLMERSAEHAVVAMDPAGEYLQETGVIHGGIVSTLADTAAVYTIMPDLGAGETMASIEFKVNFMRPALVGEGELVARARLLHRGRRTAVCEVRVTQAGRLIAWGAFTYLVDTRDQAVLAAKPVR